MLSNHLPAQKHTQRKLKQEHCTMEIPNENQATGSESVGSNHPMSRKELKALFSKFDAYFWEITHDCEEAGFPMFPTFHDQSWINLIEGVREKFNKELTLREIKEQFYTWYMQWEDFHRLITKGNGFKFDESTGMLTASDECWAEWIAANPGDAGLREKIFPFYVSMTEILKDASYFKAGIMQSRAAALELFPKFNAHFWEICHDFEEAGLPLFPTFPGHIWEKIRQQMCHEFQQEYTLDEVKERVYIMHMEWEDFHRVITEGSGFTWDSATGSLVASDECWAEWIAAYPDDARLKEKKLLCYDKLNDMFAKANEPAAGSLPGGDDSAWSAVNDR